MKDLVSVIIPVYNVKTYLNKCVDSVCNQSYDNLEILLIDDGSTDGSEHLCDDLKKKDARIRSIHKKNGGASSARNKGLAEAKGRWVIFVDADDWLEQDAIKNCSFYFEKYDLIRFGAKVFLGNEEKNIHVTPCDNCLEYLKNVVEKKELVSVWSGVYRKSLFDYNGIFFDEALVKAEDWKVLFSLAKCSKKTIVFDQSLYVYNRMNEDSCTKKVSFEKELDSLKVWRFIKEECEDSDCLLRKNVLDSKMKVYHGIMSKMFYFTTEDKSWYLEQQKEIFSIIGKVNVKEIMFSKMTLFQKFIEFLTLHNSSIGLVAFIYRIRKAL